MEAKAIVTCAESEAHRGKRSQEDQDQSLYSKSYSRRAKMKEMTPSDSEEEGPHMKDRLRRVEKAMFGRKKLHHEPVVV